MKGLEKVLYYSPWISYHDSLVQSRLLLTYPKNKIFATQLLKAVCSSDVYNEYKRAEAFDVSLFDRVAWDREFIVLDRELRVITAPWQVLQLIQLDRRLHPESAVQHIFGPFRFLPFEWFESQWYWILMLILCWYMTVLWSYTKRHTFRRLVIPSKV